MRTNNLTYLYKTLEERNFFALSRRHEKDSGSHALHIVYLNKYFEHQFITVFRTSRQSYRIQHLNNLHSASTITEAVAVLDRIMTEAVAGNKYCHVMTLAEHKTIDFSDVENKILLRKRLDKR